MKSTKRTAKKKLLTCMSIPKYGSKPPNQSLIILQYYKWTHWFLIKNKLVSMSLIIANHGHLKFLSHLQSVKHLMWHPQSHPTMAPPSPSLSSPPSPTLTLILNVTSEFFLTFNLRCKLIYSILLNVWR